MTNWRSRARPVEVGDVVGYSRQFLQSTGQYTGDAPMARGKVIALKSLSDETTLAEIDWGGLDLPPRVNVKNLSTVREIQLGE